MAIISATPRMLELIGEFGTDGSPTLRDYIRGGARLPWTGNPNLTSISSTAAGLRLSQFAGKQKEFVLSLNGWIRMFNARTHFDANHGAPTGPVLLRILINPGCRLFSESISYWPLIIGDWPAGSSIILENRGEIYGARGVPNSGSGGHCIHHSGANNVTLTVYNYGTIASGGGGGGVGGTGGMGYWQYYNDVHVGGTGIYEYCWDANVACQNAYGGNYNCASGQYVHPGGLCGCGDCYRSDLTNVYTYGGAGGTGGYGWGVYDTAGNVAGNTGGIGGAGPDTNAGWGGTGGAGGGAGANGGTGATGGSGNYTGGSGGGGGGPAGYWVYYKTGLLSVPVAGTIYGPGVAF